MRQQTRSSKEPAEKVVQDIRRATRKHYSAEEKIRIVLEGTVTVTRAGLVGTGRIAFAYG